MQPSSEPTSTAPGLEKGDSNEAIGRSRGGLTTKIHAIVDALGNPLAVSLTGGDVHDVTQAQVLTQKIEPAALLAD
jgi:Transposase DDE domain